MKRSRDEYAFMLAIAISLDVPFTRNLAIVSPDEKSAKELFERITRHLERLRNNPYLIG